MGAAGCTAGCLLDLSGCEAPVGCGNGVVEPGLGEQCDGMLLGGYTCALLRPGVYGGGVLTCRGNCTLEESGCTAVNPCGNGVREAALGEACDGAELGGATCVSLGLPGGTLACGADCRYDLGECEAPATCGDGEIDLGELCDGANLGSQTCATAGYHGGTLGCTAQCRLNLSGCTNCGNGVKDAGEVCDGAAVGTATCVSQGYYGGTLGCNVTCSALVTTGCSGRCGDGTVNGTEVCDDGVNSGGYNGCLPGCSGLGPRCGDGVINGTEVCDDGVNSGGYNGCMPGCSALGPRCGDGVINGSEVCDDGVNSGGYNGCMPGCSALGPRCGDGVINGSEVCDGLALGGDTCVAHLYTGGNLACQAGCGAVDVSGCTGGTCVDNDGDGYGTGCAAGLDCDDDAPGITGACQGNGCPAGWVYIAAGAFEMGCQSGDPCYLAYANESPRHPVTVSAYCMEATEVSVGAYRACKDGGHCAGGAPTTSASSTFCNWSAVPEGRDPHPINCINWTESQAYCQEWLGGDLPTEAEWEKAARGNEQRIYPWGSAAPDCLHTNFDVNASGSGYGCSSVTVGPGTWEVGHLVSGAGDSAYGLKDMAGNVWEWVRDWYGSTFYSDCAGGCTDPLNTSSASGYRVIRGGGFYSDGADSLRAVYRNSLAPTNRGHDLGFRCRRTP
jgi:formylglycine-generating enzyme required for sulfatase activity